MAAALRRFRARRPRASAERAAGLQLGDGTSGGLRSLREALQPELATLRGVRALQRQGLGRHASAAQVASVQRTEAFLAVVGAAMDMVTAGAGDAVLGLSSAACDEEELPRPMGAPRATWLSDTGGRSHTMGEQRRGLGVQGTMSEGVV